VHRFNKKANKNSINTENRVNEDGPGSNYRTIDPKPVSFFHDARVDVDMYPSAWGNHSVEIACPELKYDSGLRSFRDEEEATLWARNQYSDLISKLDAVDTGPKIVEAVIKRLLDYTS
jgi:hypothetical protein